MLPGGTHTNPLLHPLPTPPLQPLAAGDPLSVPPHCPSQPAPPSPHPQFMAPPKPQPALARQRGEERGRERLCWSNAAMNYSERDDNYRSPLVLLALRGQEQDLCCGEGCGAGRGVLGTEAIASPMSLGLGHHGGAPARQEGTPGILPPC